VLDAVEAVARLMRAETRNQRSDQPPGLTAANADAIGKEFDGFRQERRSLLEPRRQDVLLARDWLHQQD
jgi:hypothetical protein